MPWEVLAQLDQYYRRRKIPHDVFISVKVRLQKASLYLGNDDAEVQQDDDDAEVDVYAVPQAPPTKPKLVISEPPVSPRAQAVNRQHAAISPEPVLPSASRDIPEPAEVSPPVHVARAASPAPVVTPVAAPAAVSAPAAPAVPAPAAAAPVPPVQPAMGERRNPLRAGDLLRGRYRIVEVLRRDQSGLLLEAVDEQRKNVPEVRQRVGILLLDSHRSAEPELLQRLFRLQSLSHPNILRMFDIDRDHGELFVTTEWLSGMSLQQLIASHGGARLNTANALTILRSVASALAYAHSRDVLHGDVNAANVLVTEAGEIRLRDFELRARDATSSPVADRLAFAWLAYELLSGLHMLEFGNLRRARSSELRKPSGLDNAHWQVLRDTLIGREGAGNILAVFAGDNLADARFAPLSAFAYSPARRSPLGRMALGAAAAVVAIGAWVFVDMRPDMVSAASPAATAGAAPAATPVVTPPPPATGGAVERRASAPPAAPVVDSAPGALAESHARARLDLPSTTVEVAGNQPFATIWVRRRDNLQGTVSFRWWTETGSAVLNRDFLRIEPRTEVIPAGDRGIELRVPLLTDPTRIQPRTFYVKIDAPGAGATLGASTLTQVTIVPADGTADAAPPADAQLAQTPR